MSLKLIIGLKNPGSEYEHTRHNAGAWFVDALLRQVRGQLKEEKKLQNLVATIQIKQQSCLVATPTSYMNISGLSVRLLTQYYKIAPAELLIVYDDLDLPVGSIKLKTEGGHGGHNGIRDVIQHLGTPHFNRLRIGIGHPKQKELVHHYVLSPPSKTDKLLIDEAIQRGLDVLPLALQGEWPQAIQHLHTSPTMNKEK